MTNNEKLAQFLLTHSRVGADGLQKWATENNHPIRVKKANSKGDALICFDGKNDWIDPTSWLANYQRNCLQAFQRERDRLAIILPPERQPDAIQRTKGKGMMSISEATAQVSSVQKDSKTAGLECTVRTYERDCQLLKDELSMLKTKFKQKAEKGQAITYDDFCDLLDAVQNLCPATFTVQEMRDIVKLMNEVRRSQKPKA